MICVEEIANTLCETGKRTAAKLEQHKIIPLLNSLVDDLGRELSKEAEVQKAPKVVFLSGGQAEDNFRYLPYGKKAGQGVAMRIDPVGAITDDRPHYELVLRSRGSGVWVRVASIHVCAGCVGSRVYLVCGGVRGTSAGWGGYRVGHVAVPSARVETLFRRARPLRS